MKPAIPRSDAVAAIRSALVRNPVVALLGPRQCGKSTLGDRIEAIGLAELSTGVTRIV